MFKDDLPCFFTPQDPISIAQIESQIGEAVTLVSSVDDSHNIRVSEALSFSSAILRSSVGASSLDFCLAFVENLGALNKTIEQFDISEKSNTTSSDILSNCLVIAKSEFKKELSDLGANIITCTEPKRHFNNILLQLFPSAHPSISQFYFPDNTQGAPFNYIHPQAFIEDETVKIGSAVTIGAGAQIGSGTTIEAGSSIGANVAIGRNSFIGANASIQVCCLGNNVYIGSGSRLGGIGFGFEVINSRLERTPHIGRLLIQDHVNIGENTVINRGTLDDAKIGEGTIIDSMGMIGHNARIGTGCIIPACCAIAGSVTVGDSVLMGGAVAIGDNLTIGSGARIGGRSGVTKNIPPDEIWMGYPARRLKKI